MWEKCNIQGHETFLVGVYLRFRLGKIYGHWRFTKTIIGSAPPLSSYQLIVDQSGSFKRLPHCQTHLFVCFLSVHTLTSPSCLSASKQKKNLNCKLENAILSHLLNPKKRENLYPRVIISSTNSEKSSNRSRSNLQ